MYIHEKEIWLVDLEPTIWIEIKKIRPCLVLRKFSKNHFLVLPITSKVKWLSLTFVLENISFLKHEINYIVIPQIKTVDSSRFKRRFWQLSNSKFTLIKNKTAEVLKLLPQGAIAHN